MRLYREVTVGGSYSMESENPRFIQPMKTRLSSAGLTVIELESK